VFITRTEKKYKTDIQQQRLMQHKAFGILWMTFKCDLNLFELHQL